LESEETLVGPGKGVRIEDKKKNKEREPLKPGKGHCLRGPIKRTYRPSTKDTGGEKRKRRATDEGNKFRLTRMENLHQLGGESDKNESRIKKRVVKRGLYRENASHKRGH